MKLFFHFKQLQSERNVLAHVSLLELSFEKILSSSSRGKVNYEDNSLVYIQKSETGLYFVFAAFSTPKMALFQEVC